MRTPKSISNVQVDTAPRESLKKPLSRIWKLLRTIWIDAVALFVLVIVFVIPFIFILQTASKSSAEAALFEFNWPKEFQLFQNIQEVLAFGNNRMYLAFKNSIILTVGSVSLIVLLSALVAFVLQRRRGRVASIVSSVMLAGLVIPPAVVPTIFVLQWVGLYKTIFGLMLVEVAFTMPFATLIFRSFMGAIPSEIDEAAIIDGASPLQLFFSIILPLLQPAIITVIVVTSVAIYNDFAGPLYFLPGTQNVTVQQTLYSFMSQFSSQWNLLFADVVIITVPPFIMFMFFQRQIIAGTTGGAIRG